MKAAVGLLLAQPLPPPMVRDSVRTGVSHAVTAGSRC